jgi:TolB-like protein/lipoprotein NlpI
MASLIPEYEYDIFISYRQKDNKYDGWVTEFVDNLKKELEATFKEEISVYFDINPHDGLLETHDVDASLKEKLKCLIFIPIISRTYCDPKSFAWEHEFKAFVEDATKDQFGLKIKLPNGNVASRVLPVRIYDLDSADNKLCESVLGGVIRGVEFIFKSTGVNRPLTPSDNPDKNLHKTYYRDQINKVANAIKEIISGMKGESMEFEGEPKEIIATVEKQAVQEKSIIVLPFENMSSDSEQEYFSDGLTEEIITALSHINDLIVISRNSAMTFKGTKKKTMEIASEVNVRYVLEGSVRKSGNNLRIIAQLIDALTDAHIWAEKYSGTLDDVFDIQEKVSQSIVEALKIKLVPEEKQKILARPIDNFQVYDLHIKAQNALLASTEEGFKRALQYINKGLEIIGENEILYADMGQVYMHYIEMGIDRGENNFKKAEECAEKVFSLNPKSANGYYLRGHLKLWRGHIKESIKDLMQALSIDPNHFNSSFILAMIYTTLGKGDSARPIVQRLLKIDPLNTWSYLMSGAVEIFDGQFNQAIGFLRKAYELESFPFLKFWIAKALAYNNKLKEACQLLNSVSIEAPGTHWAQMALFLLHAIQGEISKALEIVTEDFKNTMKDDAWFTIWTAESYALLGLNEESIEWIEKGVHCTMTFINYPFLSKYDPFFERIRSEERFKKLMERVKYEWENFEV